MVPETSFPPLNHSHVQRASAWTLPDALPTAGTSHSQHNPGQWNILYCRSWPACRVHLESGGTQGFPHHGANSLQSLSFSLNTFSSFKSSFFSYHPKSLERVSTLPGCSSKSLLSELLTAD